MDFNKLLEVRRSIRDYEDKDVSTDLIKEVIRESIKAPNGLNRQEWRFVIINNKAFIKKIAQSNQKFILADLDSNPNSPYKMLENVVRSDNFAPFYNAPALVLIAGDKNVRHVPADCAILTAYFMLCAAARGLGTCFIFQGTLIQDKDILDELGITGDYRIYGSSIIGYPKAIPPMPERKEPEYLKVIE